MSELDDIRQRRIREIRDLTMRQMREQQNNVLSEQMQQAQELESQVKHIIRQILSPEAQSRLANIRLARPDFARQIEILLIQLYQSGRLQAMSDAQFKALLSKISSTRRETKIDMRGRELD
jgi:programmed cell death protein 5